MTMRIFVPRDAGALAPSAPTRSRPRSCEARRRGASTSRSCATARAACSGWSRWSRSRRRQAASPTARSSRRTSRACSTAGLLDGGGHPLRVGPAGGDPLPQAPDAPHLRALRHHRSAVARRLSRPWRLARARSAPSSSAPPATVEEVTTSGLRGRGGAGFPTGIKWRRSPTTPAAAEIHRLQRRRGRSAAPSPTA